MNDVSVAESSDLEFEPQLPDEYFPIWRCIACGAMGNSNPCMGVCDYHKLEVVRSVDYAELFDEATVIMEHLKRLTALAHRIATFPRRKASGKTPTACFETARTISSWRSSPQGRSSEVAQQSRPKACQFGCATPAAKLKRPRPALESA